MAIPSVNEFLVGASSRGVVITNPPRAPLSAADAMNLAVWLYVLASTCVGEDEVPTKEDFDAAVKAALES
jgi:hypothetical protein